MYSESYVNDAKLVVKAFLSNQLARVAPALYMRATRETGRGAGAASADEIANYFIACFDEYFEQLEVAKGDIAGWLAGRTILEYGPGDVLGVAFLFYAHGAEAGGCVAPLPGIWQTSQSRSTAGRPRASSTAIRRAGCGPRRSPTTSRRTGSAAGRGITTS